MIQKIKTEQGNCWAIVFKNQSLEDILHMQIGLVKTMLMATNSNLPELEYGFYDVLSLLSEFLFTEDQMIECEECLDNLGEE